MDNGPRINRAELRAALLAIAAGFPQDQPLIIRELTKRLDMEASHQTVSAEVKLMRAEGIWPWPQGVALGRHSALVDFCLPGSRSGTPKPVEPVTPKRARRAMPEGMLYPPGSAAHYLVHGYSKGKGG